MKFEFYVTIIFNYFIFIFTKGKFSYSTKR